MKKTTFSHHRLAQVKTYLLWGAVLWTVISAASLAWNIHYTRKLTLARAELIARLIFDKDMTFLSWVAQNGVHVHVTPTTPPNPNLHDVLDKDVSTGEDLTLMNPEYVMRQIYEQYEKSGVKGHITSLRPLRPENKPDPWEGQALKAFEEGRKEATVIQTLDGTEYMRFMKPFVTVALKCHTAQGDREGGIRGGLSVSVPMAPLRAVERSRTVMLSQLHTLLWGLGLAGIFIFGAGGLKSERARLQSDDLYRTLAESSYAGIYIIQDGKFCFNNSNMAAYTGYSAAEMIGMDASMFVHPDDREEVKRNTGSMLKRRRQDPYEFRIIGKDGGIRWIVETVTSIQYQGRRAVLGNSMDVTERKRIEEDLRRTTRHLQETTDMLIQSEKMAATGKLAAGLAHEILNPVNILSMRLQLLEQLERLSDTYQDSLSICQQQIDRIVKIIHDLDQLTQAARSLQTPCDLNGMIRRSLTVLAERLNRESIAIDLQLEEDLPMPTLDKGGLDQVFLILMNNALDAMEGRDNRRITITTESRIDHQGLRSIRMTISDRGHGIKEENLKRIFDPFFTTRAPGKGTGLGLAIVNRIIEDQGGKIWAENNEWGGAAFHIELPVVV
ncbi:MAG TPA: PAS domain S-box protein [Syntrophales bacterium]|nr:PAS domain S-box protein [Syntrophales bacterium]